jgi:uncharacterized membrane protein (TIGR02234 family)
MSGPPTPAARRELSLALVTCVAGAALALLASGRVWVRAQAVQGTLRAPLELTGAALAPAAPALALAGLAGALAVVATRGSGRRLAGLVLAGCGLGVAVVAVRAARPTEARIAGRAGEVLGAKTAGAEGMAIGVWPWLAVVGGVVVAAVGVAVVLRGPSWPGMSSRYDAPAEHRAPSVAPAPGARADDSPMEQWKALDRGDDPTL